MACVLTAAVQIILTARSGKKEYDAHLPFLERFSPNVFLLGIVLAMILAGFLAFRLYGYAFAFYGIFLSVFAEMEPLSLFGRNGFINSDFYTPVIHLFFLFWPMVLGTLIANARDFVRENPWKRLLLPFQSEIIRIHVFVLVLPFITLIAWAIFGQAYPSVTIVILMALFYFWPGKLAGEKPAQPAFPSIEKRNPAP